MKLKIRIAERAHFRAVETFDFSLFADTNRCNQVADFKPDESHDEAEYCHGRAVDDLHDELRKVTIKQTADAVGAVEFDHFITHNAVPTGPIFTGGENSHRENPPESVDAMHRDRADRIVNPFSLEEKDAVDNQDTGYRTNDRRAHWIHKRARRRNRHQPCKHAVAHHRWVGLEALKAERKVRAQRASHARQQGIYDHEADSQVGARECRARVEAKPTEREDERSKDNHWHVVARQRLRVPLCIVLADARSKDDRPRKSDNSTHLMQDTRASKVHRPVAEAPVVSFNHAAPP